MPTRWIAGAIERVAPLRSAGVAQDDHAHVQSLIEDEKADSTMSH
jgi:hypothetical protein